MSEQELRELLPAEAELYIHTNLIYEKEFQDSVWYMGDIIATIIYKGQEIKIGSCGELRIHYKDQVVRHTDRLKDINVVNDSTLNALPDEAWHNNTWFEVWSDLYPDGVVLHSAYDAIKTTIQDLNWWESIRKEVVAL